MKRSDYDTPWKKILEIYFKDFMDFLFPHISKEIDWNKKHEFLDQELKKIFSDSDLGNRCTDKLVKVWFLNGVETWVTTHIEIQGSREENFPRRNFVYYYRLFDRYDRPVISLAVFCDDDPLWNPFHFSQNCGGTKLDFSFSTVKLLSYLPRMEELEKTNNPFGLIIWAHLIAITVKKDIYHRKNMKIFITRKLYEKGFKKEDIINLFCFINGVITLPDELEIEYDRAIDQIEKEQSMEYICGFERRAIKRGLERGIKEGLEKGMQQGMQQGIQQGIQQGYQRGEAAMLLRQLQLKFKNLPANYSKRVLKADSETLMRWSEKILSVETLEEVFEE